METDSSLKRSKTPHSYTSIKYSGVEDKKFREIRHRGPERGGCLLKNQKNEGEILRIGKSVLNLYRLIRMDFLNPKLLSYGHNI